MGLCLIITHLKFNSKQSSTRDLANEILHLFKHLSSEKKKILLPVVDKCDNHVLYRIASQIWQLLQHGMPMEGQELLYLLLEEAAKKMCVILQCIFRHDFLSPCTTKFRVSKLFQHQYVLLLWWSATVATVLRPLKSVVWKYISPRINFCLYIVCFDWPSFYQDSQYGMKTVLVTNMYSTPFFW